LGCRILWNGYSWLQHDWQQPRHQCACYHLIALMMAWLFAVCEHAEYPTIAGPCHPCILFSKRSAVNGQYVQRKWTNACQSSVAKVLLPYEQHWVTCLQSLRTHKYTPPCSEKMPAGLACCTKKSFISNEKLRLKYTRFEFNLNSYKTDFQQGSRRGGRKKLQILLIPR